MIVQRLGLVYYLAAGAASRLKACDIHVILTGVHCVFPSSMRSRLGGYSMRMTYVYRQAALSRPSRFWRRAWERGYCTSILALLLSVSTR